MQHALFETNHGNIIVELDDVKAPKTVENFLNYLHAGQYNNTIFHRVIDGFMIQGGGFEPGMKQKDAGAPIRNEADNGLKNEPYTLAMARTNDPHSAAAQFFINVADNSFLNHTSPTPQGWGYAVFGEVIEGQAVVDNIRRVKVGSKGFHQDVPVENVVIVKAYEYDLEHRAEIGRLAGEPEAELVLEKGVTDLVPLIPIFRPESQQFFIYSSLVEPTEMEAAGVKFLTAPLLIGETFSLLGISQTDDLIVTGRLDSTDHIDSDVSLKALYIKTPSGNVFKHEVSAHFVAEPAGNYRMLTLGVDFDNVIHTDEGGNETRLSFRLAGQINLELADTAVWAGPVIVEPEHRGKYEVVGYDLKAFRGNTYRRKALGLDRKPYPVFADSHFVKGAKVTSFEVEGAETTLEVKVADERNEISGANHSYQLGGFDTSNNPSAGEGFPGQRLFLNILFQNGTIPEVGVNGVTLESVLAACGHRLEGFQSGKFACDDNQEALDHINAAIEALQRRTRARIARGVEGKHVA